MNNFHSSAVTWRGTDAATSHVGNCYEFYGSRNRLLTATGTEGRRRALHLNQLQVDLLLSFRQASARPSDPVAAAVQLL